MDEAEVALNEARAAIAKIQEGSEAIDLEPQPTHIRKLQHELIESHGLSSKSVGEDSQRHIRVCEGEA